MSNNDSLEYADLLCCPSCQNNLDASPNELRCVACRQGYSLSGNIPLLFWPNNREASKGDVTDIVKDFYEETPFPNYDDCDDISSLMLKARRSVFAQLLDEQLPFGTRILECGCGTGQMSNFLSVSNRTVFGTDICLNSLRLGQGFKETHELQRVQFIQMNLFRPCFKPERFDICICNGVLHHTSDPLAGFQSISRMVKPGGFLLIGLYHRYGRVITDLRRTILNWSRDRLAFLDPNLRKLRGANRRAWLMDQYKHPHESKHTIGEVLQWLPAAGFNFVHSIPNASLFQSFTGRERLFETQSPGSWLSRSATELLMATKGSREGGFFIIISKKARLA